MYHYFVAALSILAAWQWGDWRNWEVYYPTVLFYMVADYTYNLVAYRKPLWIYLTPDLKHPFFNHVIINITISLTAVPSTILIFLPGIPDDVVGQSIHLIKWVVIWAAIEWISVRLGYFTYSNGWNILWTMAHNLIMFSLLWLHFANPLLAWPISFILAFAFIFHFKIPFSSMRKVPD